MPVAGITTPLELAASEWDKLARAWRTLNPTAKDLAIKAHLDALRDEGKLRIFPTIPGWDDVLKLGRVPAYLTEAELKARRIRVAVRIRQSAAPPTAQATALIINAIDDVEDLASFTGLVARLIIRAAPRALGRGLPALKWIATAADVLNLLTLLTMVGGTLAGIHTQGILGGVAEQGSTIATKGAMKAAIWIGLRKNRFKKLRVTPMTEELTKLFSANYKLPQHTAAKYAALITKRVTIGELLEAAQATQTLTGYGISLGAIMGYLSDFSWALFQKTLPAQRAGHDALVKAVRATIPEEFFLVTQHDELQGITFDGLAGKGPAYEDWFRALGSPPSVIGSVLDVGANLTVDGPAWCYLSFWVHSPAYPKTNSITAYAVSGLPPSNDYVRARLSNLGSLGLVYSAQPTSDGL